jgi:uncharacterized 2Fe-2S/4Fe-4S cluster protein (DUF4445 family)
MSVLKDSDIEIVVVKKGIENNRLRVEKGANLYEVLKKNKLLGDYPCAGKGICGKCKVKITSGAPASTPDDERYLTREELEEGVRLTCRTTVSAPMELIIEGSDTGTGLEILTAGVGFSVEIDSPVHKKHMVLEKTGADDRRPDFRRIADGMAIKDMSAEVSLLRKLSATLRESDNDFTATVYNDMLIGVDGGNTEAEKYGIAADIGTTTVVCYLVELSSGRIADVEARANSQRTYGADVISRIGFTTDNDNGTETLRGLIIGQINGMISCLCDRNGITPHEIHNIAVTGNTTMIHFFLGLPTKNIAIAPFTPVMTDAADFRASDVGIGINGIVSVMPGIASYVGSDITAGILACGMTESDGYSLLLDLGTNGEIALGNSHGVTACAVAAGPAFEGGNIKYGVGGIKGAICKVDLGKANSYETIGGAAAIGICGSGVLDIVSELLKYGIIDETGRMMGKEAVSDKALAERLCEENGVRQILMETETELGVPITFTQKDVREIQLAKAAVSAGISVLLKDMNLSFGDIEKIYIAGGFGNFMNMESSLNIGLIPEELRGKTVSAGNTAGSGARLYLLSQKCRQKVVQIAELASYIELSTRVEFQDYYVDAMSFE